MDIPAIIACCNSYYFIHIYVYTKSKTRKNSEVLQFITQGVKGLARNRVIFIKKEREKNRKNENHHKAIVLLYMMDGFQK